MHDWLSICMDRPKQVFPKFCRDVWFPEKTSLIITFVRYYLRTFEGTFVDYLFAKWEGFEVRRYGYHQCLPRSSHGYYLFLWGIDAIICSPLMTCSCTRHSLVFSLSGRFTDCFLALSCPAGTIIYLVRTKMYYLRTKIMNLSWFLELIDPHRRYKKSRLGEKFPLKSRNLIDWSSDPKWHNSRLLKD